MATQVVTRLTEKWDVRMLQRLAASASSLDHDSDRSTLLHAVLQINHATGEVHTKYKYGKKTPFGRLYASGPSLQHVSKWIRNLCASSIYHDIDIVNCFPSLLQQIVQRHGLACPHLTHYVTNREAVFQKVNETYSGENAGATLTREQLKKCFLVSLHNGGYQQITSDTRIAPLDDFTSEIRRLGNELAQLDEYKREWTEAASRLQAHTHN